MLSYPEASSTCYLVALIVEELYGVEQISHNMAVNLFVGMMTDTGNFAFSSVTPDVFRMVSVLAATGISIPDIHNHVYNSFTEGRARLFGYVINRKMKMSAMFTEHSDFIRVSLRSRGDVDVNVFAQRYFNGGGHRNAAGGKSFVSMEETLAHYENSVKEYAAEGKL